MDLVCDTNIWYGIADGRIDPKSIKKDGHRLLASHLNILELLSSMYVSNYSARRKAAVAIIKHADDYLESSEFHLSKLWGIEPLGPDVGYIDAIDILANSSTLQAVWRGGKNATGKRFNLDMNSAIKWREDHYSKFKSSILSICDIIVPKFSEIRMKGKSFQISKDIANQFRKFSSDPKIRERLLMASFERVATGNRNLTIPGDQQIRSASVSLDAYLRAYLEYLVYSVESKPPDENDLGDLEFLLYVQNSRVFFTKEKRWLTIGEAVGLGGKITANP